MLINNYCPVCFYVIEPIFYVQYFLKDCEQVIPMQETAAAIPNFHLLITYYDPRKAQIIYGQLYDFSCFCNIATNMAKWQLTEVSTEIKKSAANKRLQFPTFNPARPQNFPRTHFFKYHDLTGFGPLFLEDFNLQAIQQNIEADRFNTEQYSACWFLRQQKLIHCWQQCISIMRKYFSSRIPENILTIFDTGTQLLDLRLIRNVLVITIPLQGHMLPLEERCKSLLEGII